MRIGAGRFVRFRNISGMRQAKFLAKSEIMHWFFCAGDWLVRFPIEGVARVLPSQRDAGKPCADRQAQSAAPRPAKQVLQGSL